MGAVGHRRRFPHQRHRRQAQPDRPRCWQRSTSASSPTGNDPAIKSLNKGVNLPNLKITRSIFTFTYAIVPRRAKQAGLLKQFIKYALTTGQHFGAALDFAPIPKVVISAANKAVNGL
jgi:hypothetical protein